MSPEEQKKHREYMREYRKNPEARRKHNEGSNASYHKKMADPVKREKHTKRCSKYQLELLKKNPEYALRQKELEKMITKRWRNIVLDMYGNKCNCCGETINRFLTIDHINNDGYKERRGRKHGTGKTFWKKIAESPKRDDLEIACYNCNCARALNGGVCPHKDILESITGIK